MPANAKFYISLVSAAGLVAMACAFVNLPLSHDLLRFSAYLALSLFAATLKLKLPGLTGTMSVGFVFVLLGIAQLTLPETMLIACAGVVLQCLWRAKVRPAPVQILFSVSAAAIGVMLAYACSTLVRRQLGTDPVSVIMAVATCLYFMSTSMLVSGVLSLVKRESFASVWQQCYLYSFPYYLLGGAVAGLMAASSHQYGWTLPLLILPVMGLAYFFYRFYLTRLAIIPEPLFVTEGLHRVEAGGTARRYETWPPRIPSLRKRQ